MDKYDIFSDFEEIETEREYDGYFFSVSAVITIAICGTFCGLRNMKQIHQWASNEKIKEFLKNNFGIEFVPCYSWFTQILGLIKPESFSKCFTKWICRMTGDISNRTISLDGKSVRSTGKMKNYDNPLHIVSAQIGELGVTIGQVAVDGKSNEIPAVRELIDLINIKKCVVVADALNCQTETAQKIIDNGGDYLLSAKENQRTLKAEIADYVRDGDLRKSMDMVTKTEKNRDRIETRTAYATCDIDWLYGKEKWANLCCIGAINTQFETAKGKTDEWHYYISSRAMSAQELLERARKEWSIESMHWLLDVHFSEDFCRAAELLTQENLNIIRKIVINSMRIYKQEQNSKAAFTHLMLDCMIDPQKILRFLEIRQN
jgi:predicted transposase YbfD/YdcC